MSDSGRRHARLIKHLLSDEFANIAWILDRIVEMKLFHPMEQASALIWIELERESRFVINLPETSGGAFQVDKHIGVDERPFPHRGMHVLMRLLAQCGNVRRSDSDPQMEDSAVGKKRIGFR